MTMKTWLSCILFFSVAVLFSTEKNLISNGQLECGTGDVPYCWYFSGSRGNCLPDGGPGNMGYVLFQSSGVKAEQAMLRQGGLVLIPGEKYRLSCKVRTKGFSAEKSQFLIHDNAWRHTGGSLTGFPADTPWKEFSREVTLSQKCSKGEFGAVLYLKNFQGEIAFSNIKLIPLTEKAKATSRSSMDKLTSLKLLEIMSPRLNAVPFGTESLPVYWNGDSSSSQLTAEEDGNTIGKLSFREGFYRLPVKPGCHTVTISVSENGKTCIKKHFEYTVLPAEPDVAEKRLNAFTTELVNKELNNVKEFTFTVPRRSWIYFKFTPEAKVNASLSGLADPLITDQYLRNETQRRLNAGKYTITFRQPFSGKLILRTVPVIYKYAGINGSAMKGIGGSDLAFHEKYVFGVFNTLGARGVPEKIRPYTVSLGMECVDNLRPPAKASYTKANVEKFKARLLDPQEAFFVPSSQWVEFDEYFWLMNDGLLTAADALPFLKNPYRKDLFHWFGGIEGPILPGIHHKAASVFMNAGGGRGYLAYEVYFRSKKTEKAARQEITDILKGSVKRMNSFVPGSNRAFGFIYGNFHQLPILSLDHHPEVNYKYFLDMQFQIAASDPLFNGIGLTGFWGFNYANEEIARWCCALVRHYVLEGKTEMLSAKYGYTYLLPHLQNGDFEDGLKTWQVEGDITCGMHRNFGALSEHRRHGNPAGDRFAVFHGHAGKINTLTQTAQKLIPGKIYSLEFITADYDDVKAGKVAPRFFPVSVELPGAKILKKFDYVDQRTKGRDHAKNARTNYRSIHFIPGASTQKLIFKDRGQEDENLLLNFVRIAPFFMDN